MLVSEFAKKTGFVRNLTGSFLSRLTGFSSRVVIEYGSVAVVNQRLLNQVSIDSVLIQ